MSLHTSVTKFNKEAIKEALYAAELLIKFRKNSDWDSLDKNDNGCLGYPAAILLFAYIETAGCIFINKHNAQSFLVLKTDLFNNQEIDKALCLSLYNIYRNKLVHNLILPKEAFLQVKFDIKEPLHFNHKGKKGKTEINSINLYALLEICKKSYIKLEKIIDERLLKATHIENLAHHDLNMDETKLDFDITPSGYVGTVSGLSSITKKH